jgi:hypothetical protein
LPGLRDDGMEAIHQVPDAGLLVGLPAQRGNADPIELYGDALDRLDAATRDAFMVARLPRSRADG